MRSKGIPATLLPSLMVVGTREDKKTSTLKYDLRGKTCSIEYTMNKDGTFTFVYTDGDGERTTETHRRREKGKDKGKPKKDERE